MKIISSSPIFFSGFLRKFTMSSDERVPFGGRLLKRGCFMFVQLGSPVIKPCFNCLLGEWDGCGCCENDVDVPDFNGGFHIVGAENSTKEGLLK